MINITAIIALNDGRPTTILNLRNGLSNQSTDFIITFLLSEREVFTCYQWSLPYRYRRYQGLF